MRKLIAAAFVVGVLAAVGGIAYATIPDENGVIHGCRNNGSGSLRVIDSASQSCTPAETALDWNQLGPKGDKGDPGGVLDVYFNRDTDVLPAGAVRGYRAQCGDGDKAIGGGYASDSTDVTAFRSDVDLINPAYLLGLKNNGNVAAAIQFTAYCADLTP
jgi:hypothetical protein